jgi:prepilin-type processing-associated H-X9-DG protein
VVVAAAGGTSEKPLAESPAFAALRKRLSPTASALAYCNSPSLVRRFYGVVLAGGTALTNALGGRIPGIRPEMLPALPKVEKYIWPDMSAVSSDAKGITIESYGSLPSGMLLNLSMPKTSPAVPALAVGMIVPALQQARGRAKQAMSAVNLSTIGKAIAMYQVEHDDRFPPNLAALIEEGIIPAKMLYSPSSGREPRLDSKGKPVGPIDYVYLGADLDPSAPASLIVAYERPEINRDKGTAALFVDGHVEWLRMERFRRELERTQEYIKKKGGV